MKHTAEYSEDSNSMSNALAPRTMNVRSKPKVEERKSVRSQIENLGEKLILEMSIISPLQVQGLELRKQLKNYRYSLKKKEKRDFSSFSKHSSKSEEIEIQQIYMTLKDIFQSWRAKVNHKFYILLPGQDLLYFAHKTKEQDLKNLNKKGGSYLIVSSQRNNFEMMRKQQDCVSFVELPKSEREYERLLYHNSSISIFWRWFAEDILSNFDERSLEIVANFQFLNSSQVLPLETYSGAQNRTEFQHLALLKESVLGEQSTQLFNIRLEGMWFEENICDVYEHLKELCHQEKEDKFMMQFRTHPSTESIQEELSKY